MTPLTQEVSGACDCTDRRKRNIRYLILFLLGRKLDTAALRVPAVLLYNTLNMYPHTVCVVVHTCTVTHTHTVSLHLPIALFTLLVLLLSRTWLLCLLCCCQGNQGKHVALDAVLEHFLMLPHTRSSIPVGTSH